MTPALFAVTRADGRSDTQVLIDHVTGAEPGHVYPFAELIGVLSARSDRVFDVDAVRHVVRRTLPRLLKEQQRALHSVRGVGYRLAYATDQKRLSLDRNRRANMQRKVGLLLLRHVRWDELDPEARKAHEGTLILMSALYEAQMGFEKRLARVEAAIKHARDGEHP
jgi:hypothetical protein